MDPEKSMHEPLGSGFGTPDRSNTFAQGNEAPSSAPAVQPPASSADSQLVDNVLYSDIGVNTLLVRLKQSIASAQDFAGFLKKRSSIEESHAQGLKKLYRSTHDAIFSSSSRGGSYAQQFDNAARLQDRMGDNGMQFALSLHQMHEDLNELSNTLEKGRKHWKAEGLTNEKKVQDVETLTTKAKAKYQSLAEDLDRIKTGDKVSGKIFGLKGPKSSAQQEEDLQRKLQAADSDYATKVKTAQDLRQELVNSQRPQAIKALLELIKECDLALSLQFQKYGAFNEKLLLGNGLLVAPIPGSNGEQLPPSLRDYANQVDNEKDLNSYITSHTSKVPGKTSEVKYEKHPVSARRRSRALSWGNIINASKSLVQPQQSTPVAQRQSSIPQQPPLPQQDNSPSQAPPHFPMDNNSHQQSPINQQQQPFGHQGPVQQDPFYRESPYQDNTYGGYQQSSYPAQAQAQAPAHNESPLNSRPPQLDYPQTNTSQFPSSQPHLPQPNLGHTAGQQSVGVVYNQPPAAAAGGSFGMSLAEISARDESPVPIIVYQCIQAVDLYGLEVEGIYRIPGTASHIQQLREMFSGDASRVDFRNPASFQHDINSVAGLLKKFFGELRDPLFTKAYYQEFIKAARIDDDIVRRDSMHKIINELPDPNYATIRALVLHLHRVQEHATTNRMSASNLAICFAPTLMMGNDKSPPIGSLADAGLQARVLETVLSNTLQIFDED